MATGSRSEQLAPETDCKAEQRPLVAGNCGACAVYAAANVVFEDGVDYVPGRTSPVLLQNPWLCARNGTSSAATRAEPPYPGDIAGRRPS